jgi:subtilase family serine protease
MELSGRYRSRAAVAALGAAALTVLGFSAAAGATRTGATPTNTTPASATPAGRVLVPDTHPAWATAARRVTAPDTAGQRVTARVYLAGRDPAGLAAYATAVSDPGNLLFRKFLTARQEQQRFGPTSAQLSAVTRWLAAAGLRVTAVTRHYVAVTGSVTAAQAAFAVRLASFRAPGGSVAMAPEQNVSVPATVAPAVLTVTGLDTATQLTHPALASADTAPADTAPAGTASTPAGADGLPAAFYRAAPCSQYYGQRRATTTPVAYGKHVSWGICGYTPSQLRGAYGVGRSPSIGSGVTVAVVDAYASPTMPADASTYAAAVGDPRLTAGQYHQVLPKSYDDQSQCGASGWYEEQTLDVEAVHALAPGADIEYVAASDCALVPLLDAVTTVVDNHLADVLTDSWDGSEQGLDLSVTSAYNQVLEEAATEGISVNFASGDCGYNDPSTSCGQADFSGEVQANFPGTSPWVTAVGGTSLAIGKHSNYEWETGWGDMVVPRHGRKWQHSPPGVYPADYSYGSGGGTSMIYQQPSFQVGVVPRALATRLPNGHVAKTPMREVPDISLDADPATGFLFGETVILRGGKPGFQLSRIGGTSLSSPLMAALEADAAAQTSQDELGFIDPALYHLAHTAAFHDIISDPLGPGVRVALARNDWAKTTTGTGKITTSLYTLGDDGSGRAALHVAKGFDDVTGLGSPASAFVCDLAGQFTGSARRHTSAG